MEVVDIIDQQQKDKFSYHVTDWEKSDFMFLFSDLKEESSESNQGEN